MDFRHLCQFIINKNIWGAEKMNKYIIYLNFHENILEYPLPSVIDRRVDIDLSEHCSGCVLHLEYFDNIWKIISDDNVCINVGDERKDEHILCDGDVLNISVSDESFAMIVSKADKTLTEFTKYSLGGVKSITMGKNRENDISLNDKFISSEHCLLESIDGAWYITDKSLNGTFINGHRIKDRVKLCFFDVIYTVGFKMVFLGDILAINRNDSVVCKLVPADEKEDSKHEVYKAEPLFTRSPRTLEPLYDELIEIEAPPTPQKQKNQPLIFIVGPSVTMPLPIIMSTFLNTQLNGAASNSYMATIASVGMSAILGAGWAVAHMVYNKRSAASEEKFRIAAYREYIGKNDKLLHDKHNLNSSILMTQYLSSAEISQKILSDNRSIWNRNRNHDDFLTIRLGLGSVRFEGRISVPKQRFSLNRDDLAELPHELYDKYEYMHDSTVLLRLRKHRIIGMIGDRSLSYEIAAGMIIQIAALHCYTDVKIAAFFRQSESEKFGWVRWLPHTGSDDAKLRMVADDAQSYSNVLYYIDGVLRSRYEELCSSEDGNKKTFFPHYVIFCTSEEIFSGDGIEKYISIQEDLGVTFVLLYETIDRLPNECTQIIRCDNDFIGMYSLMERRSETDRFVPDTVSYSAADGFARSVSGLRVKQFSVGEIPNSINYFDMIGIGRLEQWNLIKRYKENRAYEGIRSFVGIGTGGKPIYLDIHEKKYGPHGLVAGTTGSGKSETLQTFILSLAMNYSPDEVAFVLIDFKGGGMAGAFTGIPHLAGMITNLGGESAEDGDIDPNLTRRALVSIKSEMTRRQLLFNKYKLTHIDTYSRLYREKQAEEPLPHLIIISDEFAELKRDQPEFIKELVRTARIGRSLGIHLILATQKPAGVVDDDIWSNSKFKLCLKVQDKQDSMGMLKRPEAAYLTKTGRAYLQIGNDEVFEQFQTGYSGAEYFPKDEVSAASEADFSMIGIDGSELIIREQKVDTKKEIVTQLNAACKYITEVCAENSISPVRALWLPVLGTDICLEDVEGKYPYVKNGVTAVFGLIDDPENQRQLAAYSDLSANGNLIITGISGCGKTTLIETILCSVIRNYSCEEAVFYILDFSGRTLKLFSDAPHCGTVAFSDENETVERMFRFINSEIERRKKLFSSRNVGGYKEYTRENKLPLMLFVIDNFFSFSELYPQFQDSFMSMTRDCAKYGIQVIISVNNTSDIRHKLSQNFNNHITLMLSERGDYHDILGATPEFMPENKKGRGITLSNGHLLEFQTALPSKGKSEAERNKAMSQLISEIKKRDGMLIPAAEVPILHKEQPYSVFFESNKSENKLPLGYAVRDISVYSLDLLRTYCFAVSDSGYKGINLVIGNMLYAAKNISGSEIHIVKLCDDVKLYDRDASIYKRENIRDLLLTLKAHFKERAADKRAFLASDPEGDYAGYICGKYNKCFVFIDSFGEFLNVIYDSSNEEDMHSITETFFKQGAGLGVYFIAGMDAAAYSQQFYSAACRNFTAYKSGIHMGGRFDKQKLFEVSMSMSQMAKPLDHYIGYTVSDDREFSVFIPFEKEQ